MLTGDGSSLLVRSRARLIGCCAGLAVFAALLLPATSGATIVQTQLSLGDSQAFGYSLQLFNEHSPAEATSNFEKGYAKRFFTMHGPGANGIQLVNDGCPGETTDSFIGNGPLGAAIDPGSGEAPCAYHNSLGYPLHHPYGALGQSQLENALETIAFEAASGTPVTTITLNIGNNDLLHMRAKCEAEVAAEFAASGTSIYGVTPAMAVAGCIVAHVPATIAHIVTNTERIIKTLRFGSSYLGVNYTGAIVFLGTYNPYGKLFSTAAQLATWVAAEGLNVAHYAFINTTAALLPGWDTVIQVLNSTELAALTPAPYSVCYADPQKTSFPLPAFYGFNELPGAEPAKLKGFTNMANLLITGGNFDGPDIHPTVMGYLRLARIMNYSCPTAPS
jgi:hypothetical protein